MCVRCLNTHYLSLSLLYLSLYLLATLLASLHACIACLGVFLSVSKYMCKWVTHTHTHTSYTHTHTHTVSLTPPTCTPADGVNGDADNFRRDFTMDRQRVAKSHTFMSLFLSNFFFPRILCQKKRSLVYELLLVSAEQKDLKSKQASQ
jgi:hypothetical protein